MTNPNFKLEFTPNFKHGFDLLFGNIFLDDSSEEGIPIENLLAYVKMVDGVLVDSIGESTREIYKQQYIQADGVGSMYHADLTTGCTIESAEGTVVHLTPGTERLYATSGKLWDFSIRFNDNTLSTYGFGSKLSDSTAICYDTSGFKRHLRMDNFTDYELACADSVSEGSDVLNQSGYSDRENLFDSVLSASTSDPDFYFSEKDEDGFCSITKVTTGSSSSVGMFVTAKRPLAQDTSYIVRMTLRAIAGHSNGVDIGWYLGGFSGNIGEIVSGPGSISVANKATTWASITGLSETEDTIITLEKDNFVVGESVVQLLVYAGSVVSTTVGDGCKIKDMQVSEGSNIRSYTDVLQTEFSLMPMEALGTPNPITNLTVIGDSFASTNLTNPMIELFPGSNVVNKGVGGETSAQILSRFQLDVVDSGATECLIIAGTNGAFQGVPLDDYKSHILAMIGLAENNGIGITLSNLPPFNTHTLWTQAMQDFVEAANVWIETLGYPVVNIFNALRGDSESTIQTIYDSGDHLHPNVLGFAGLANNVYSVMDVDRYATDTSGDTLVYNGRVKYNLLIEGDTFAFPLCYDLFLIDQAAGGDLFYSSVDYSLIYLTESAWINVAFVNQSGDGRVGVGPKGSYVYSTIQTDIDYAYAQKYIGNIVVADTIEYLGWHDSKYNDTVRLESTTLATLSGSELTQIIVGSEFNGPALRYAATSKRAYSVSYRVYQHAVSSATYIGILLWNGTTPVVYDFPLEAQGAFSSFLGNLNYIAAGDNFADDTWVSGETIIDLSNAPDFDSISLHINMYGPDGPDGIWGVIDLDNTKIDMA